MCTPPLHPVNSAVYMYCTLRGYNTVPFGLSEGYSNSPALRNVPSCANCSCQIQERRRSCFASHKTETESGVAKKKIHNKWKWKRIGGPKATQPGSKFTAPAFVLQESALSIHAAPSWETPEHRRGGLFAM